MEITLRQRIITIQSHLKSFALKLTGNDEQASDLLQDTTLKVLDNPDKYADNQNFTGWAFTIMRNIFINDYRKRTRHATLIDSSEDLFRINSNQESTLPNTEEIISAKEILRTMRGLTADYRVPFTLYVKGYHYSEISKMMHLPLGTVKSRIFFARKKLQEELKDFRADA